MSLTILGINPAMSVSVGSFKMGSHDPGACLLKDGEVLAAVEEERFTKNKWGLHSRNQFPANSINFVLDYADISSVDVVAIGWDPSNSYKKTLTRTSLDDHIPTSLSDLTISGIDKYITNNYMFAKNFRLEYTNKIEDEVRGIVQSQLNSVFDSTFSGDIIFVPHHRSHAASAHFCSGFDQQLTITADGGGEHHTTVLWSEDLDIIREFTRPNSLGHFYNTGTGYLGYTKPASSRHAGKTMGLAPYGSYREDFAKKFDELVDINNGGYDITKFRNKSVSELEELFGERHTFPDDFEQHHKDFAFHLQQKLEEIVKHIVRSLVEQSGINNISVAGGVFLNCKMNREIANLDCVDDMFIQPAAHDAGVAIGAALDVHHSQTGKKPVENFDTVYFGSEYHNSEIEPVIENMKIEYEKIDDVAEKAATLLADNQLIGWFQGRMEFGPRALGNRSILANPRSVEARDLVNKNVKNREKWRPFAPSLLYDAKDEYLEDGFESPYMIMTDSIREEKRDEVPGIVHADGTARPQTVTEEQNKRYYNLIKEFEKITGTPVLLNTSFNVSGEPIVESPQQAIADFYSTGLDALFIGDYLIKK